MGSLGCALAHITREIQSTSEKQVADSLRSSCSSSSKAQDLGFVVQVLASLGGNSPTFMIFLKEQFGDNKVAQNLVAKPTVFTLFYSFCGPGIQEHLEGFWLRVWPEIIDTC